MNQTHIALFYVNQSQIEEAADYVNVFGQYTQAFREQYVSRFRSVPTPQNTEQLIKLFRGIEELSEEDFRTVRTQILELLPCGPGSASECVEELFPLLPPQKASRRLKKLLKKMVDECQLLADDLRAFPYYRGLLLKRLRKSETELVNEVFESFIPVKIREDYRPLFDLAFRHYL